MRKNNKIKKLGRNAKQRKALNKALFLALTRNDRIKTTLAKAKAVKSFAERQIFLARKYQDNPAEGLRLLNKKLSPQASKKALDLAKRYKDINGGCLRIIKLPSRKSDASEMALLEWTLLPEKAPEEKGKKDKNGKKNKQEKSVKK